MALSQVLPVVNRGVISNWLEDLPAVLEMLTVDTDGNVSHQSIPVASFAALTGVPGDNAALASALSGKASVSHTHEIANVTGLQAALDSKAATTHTHVIADTAGLQAALDAKLGGSTGGTDNRILRADGTGGATVQSSAITIDDSGNISGIARATANAYDVNVGGALTWLSGFNENCVAAGVKRLANQSVTQGVCFNVVGEPDTLTIRRLDNAQPGNLSCQSIITWDLRNNSGIRIRNYANSAWAPIQCGAMTVNGTASMTGDCSVIGHFAPGSSITGSRFSDGFSGDRMRLVSRFASISGSFDQLRFDPSVNIAWCSDVTTNSADLRLNRAAAGQLNLLGNLGLRIRNLADSADGPLTASTGIFSGQVNANNLMLNNYQWIGWGGLNLLAGDGAGLRANFCPFTQITTLGCVTANISGLLNVGTYTVATLPSAAANAGALAQVTDSSVTANGSAVAGGGSNRVVVFSNGSTWDVVVA